MDNMYRMGRDAYGRRRQAEYNTKSNDFDDIAEDLDAEIMEYIYQGFFQKFINRFRNFEPDI